jgi:hypothetical protein
MPRVYLVDERVGNARLALETIPQGDLGLPITPALSVSEILATILDAMTAAESGAGAAGRPRAASKSRGAGQSSHDEPETFLISELRILASGRGDELLLGQGVDVRNVAQLAPLFPYMRTAASGRCLLLGCNVAIGTGRVEHFLGGSAEGQRFGSPYHGRSPDEIGISPVPGYALLHAFARTLGVPTTAALESQRPPLDWQFTGATLTVDPFGNVTYAGMDTPATFWM